MKGRFTKAAVTKAGRIGHPGAIERRLVKCTGVIFEDLMLRKKWTFRMYEAYGPDWPAMDVWTVQVSMPSRTAKGRTVEAWGPQTPVREQDVPDDVKRYALAELVRLRLRGEVRA